MQDSMGIDGALKVLHVKHNDLFVFVTVIVYHIPTVRATFVFTSAVLKSVVNIRNPMNIYLVLYKLKALESDRITSFFASATLRFSLFAMNSIWNLKFLPD